MRIGSRVKCQTSFICEGVTIEDEVFIRHAVVFINDRYPRVTAEGGARRGDGDWECTPRWCAQACLHRQQRHRFCGVTIGEEAIGHEQCRDAGCAKPGRSLGTRLACYVR